VDVDIADFSEVHDASIFSLIFLISILKMEVEYTSETSATLPTSTRIKLQEKNQRQQRNTVTVIFSFVYVLLGGKLLKFRRNLLSPSSGCATIHGVTSQITLISIFTAVRASDLVCIDTPVMGAGS
jgi:hypothetical protein